MIADVTTLGFRPASSGRELALLSGDPLIPPRPSAFCLDGFASPGHSVRMRSSNLGALLAAGSREAANTAQEDSGDPAGGVGTSDPQPRLQDSHTHHPAPRGHFLSTSPGLGSRSGLGDAREQGTRVPTCPRGPAQRGSSDHSLGGWGVWWGSGPSPPVTVGPPGGGLLARCPLRWTLACMGRHLCALSLRPARVTSPELSAWWVLVASPWDSSGRGPPGGGGTGAWLRGQG